MRIIFLFLLLGSCSGLKKMNLSAPQKRDAFFRIVWNKNLDPSYESGNLPISFGAPRIYEDIVFQGSKSGRMHAYDLETGRVLWAYDEGTPLGAAAEFFENHVAYGGLNGRLFLRHYLTGKLKYAIDLGAPIESAPFYFKGRLLLYLRGHQIVQLDAETGKILWAYKRAVPITTTLQRTTKPLVLGDKIIVGFADGYLGALSVQEGLVLWETKLVEQGKFVDIDLNPLFMNDLVITGSPSGELKAIVPQTGAVARTYPFSVMAHPFNKGEQLILGTNEGEVILLSLAGEVLKRKKISSQPVSAVAWWKDTIIAASFDGKLRALDPLNMNVIDIFNMGDENSALYSDLVMKDDFLAIYTSRNRLYVFRHGSL